MLYATRCGLMWNFMRRLVLPITSSLMDMDITLCLLKEIEHDSGRNSLSQ